MSGLASTSVQNIMSAFLSESNTTSDTSDELISELFEATTKEYNETATIQFSSKLAMSEEKKAFITILRNTPTVVSLRLIREATDESHRRQVVDRCNKLVKYLLAFQPAILRPIEAHFKKTDSGATVKFRAKAAGRQEGTVARVTFTDGREETYFVKTHRTFQISEDSFAHFTSDSIRYMDYKELFVYRVLSALDIGPAVEFVFPVDTDDGSETGLLIASLDLAQHTRTDGPTEFTSFGSLCGSIRGQLRVDGLTGAALGARLNAAADALFSAYTARRDLKRIDLVCRIMHLSDVLVNPGNFGLLRTNQGDQVHEVGWRVVDFTVTRPGLRRTSDSYIVFDIRRQFKEVSGMLHYTENPPLRKALLESAQLGEQLKQELLLESDGVPRLWGVLCEAEREIVKVVEDNRAVLRLKDDELHARKVADLRAYAEGVFRNLQAV